MSITKKYFKNQLKLIAKPLIIITVIVMVLTLLSLSDVDDFYYYRYDINGGEILDYRYDIDYYSDEYEDDVIFDDYYDDYYYDYYYGDDVELSDLTKTYETMLAFPCIVLIIMCLFVPFGQFKFFKIRRNLDFAYALPISRKNLGVIHYLVGLVYSVIPFLSVYLMLLLRITFDGAWIYLNAEYIALNFVSSLLLGITIYSLVAFLYNEANNKLDGIIFVMFWNYILPTISLFVIFDPMSSTTFSPMSFAAMLSTSLVSAAETTPYDLYHLKSYQFVDKTYPFIATAFWVLIGIAAITLFITRFGKTRTEKIEGISDSIFGYKTLIPFYAFIMLFQYDFEEKTFYIMPFLGISTFILSLIGYAVYRRGLKFKKSDLIVLGIIAFITVLSYLGLNEIAL